MKHERAGNGKGVVGPGLVGLDFVVIPFHFLLTFRRAEYAVV